MPSGTYLRFNFLGAVIYQQKAKDLDNLADEDHPDSRRTEHGRRVGWRVAQCQISYESGQQIPRPIYPAMPNKERDPVHLLS